MEKLPTVFIDRDGTINIEAGYINHPDNFHLYKFVPQAIRLLNLHNILAVVLTNQAGVGRGHFGEDNVHRLHKKMYSVLAEGGAKVDGLYYCPHHTSSKDPKYAVDCNCRKPRTGMPEQAIKDLPVDTSKMYMIGDKKADMELGFNIGGKSILVKTGYGLAELESIETWKHKPCHIAENLLDAVLFILKDLG